MWKYLDEQFPSGYQDTLVLHMMYKPVKVSYELDQTRYVCVCLSTFVCVCVCFCAYVHSVVLCNVSVCVVYSCVMCVCGV